MPWFYDNQRLAILHWTLDSFSKTQGHYDLRTTMFMNRHFMSSKAQSVLSVFARAKTIM